MNFLKSILGRKEQWVEFDTLYSTQRLERLRIFMAENNIPYKVRAALLLVPLNTPMPTGAVTQSFQCNSLPYTTRTIYGIGK